MVKISLDAASCCGTGYCERVAPEIFKVVDDKVTLREDADVTSVEPERIRRAASACPWRAILVSD
ncbi:ferredoxin [Phenylobacterium sp. LjRoot219]|uniref:ferredoxin n=1 Tax=Phenylobacterium sp. LjRoot219 TaxID=3342283 RepID=UPI003F500AA5